MAWPGPGNVGLMTLDYLRFKFNAERFAQLDISSLFSPSSIIIKEGKFVQPTPPNCVFYFKKEPALIFFKCDTLFAEKESLSLVNYVVELAKEWGVKSILTVGGFLKPMNHSEHSDLCFAASDEQIAREFESAGLIPLPDGEISGPIGLVPTVAAGNKIKAACILATMPVYAGAFFYPKATFEILKGLELLLHFQIDLTMVEQTVEKMEDTFEIVEGHIREHLPFILSSNVQEQPEPEKTEEETDEGTISQSVKIRLEKLFEETARDKSKAGELKKELDRWGLYSQFEDRFLDLFKNNGEEN
jgi:predicted ATP-grasp superfamily ATP-dependent carboligase